MREGRAPCMRRSHSKLVACAAPRVLQTMSAQMQASSHPRIADELMACFIAAVAATAVGGGVGVAVQEEEQQQPRF